MKKLLEFPVAFTNPFSGNYINDTPVYCHIFEDEGEAWECYDYMELAKICHLNPKVFYEFCEKDHPTYITAMAFVEMCFYSPNLLSNTTCNTEFITLPALQDMAIDLLRAATNAHWPAQAMINKELKEQA